MKFDVFWTDCEGQRCSASFAEQGAAESFAKWCHELGDTDISIEIRETEQ